MIKFDPNQALPLFQIVSPRTKMNVENQEKDREQKSKKKNKKLEVQVHKSQKDLPTSDLKIHKTFSANFSVPKTKHRHKNEESDKEDKIEETEQKTKVKRKYLMKENDKLTHENIELTDQLVTLQSTVEKRDSIIVKLREKLSSVQNFNKEILNESNIIKMQYEDLLVELEKFKTEKDKCANCDELKIIIKKNYSDIELNQKENKSLTNDMNMLKNVVYRLNVQLERYQEKLRKNKISFTNTQINENDPTTNITSVEDIPNHSDHRHSPISWGNVNAHTLGPLLDAYQDTVREKEDIINNYETELSKFTGKLKDIINENETLHKKNLENSDLLKKTSNEFEDMKNELKNTKEQNEVLIKKCAVKHDKLQELCKIYDHKISSMQRDYSILQEQHHKARAELASIQAKYQVLVDSNEALKNDRQEKIPLSVHTASVNECKRLFEELKLQYETEKHKLLKQIKQYEEQLPNMETQIVELSTEKQELQIKVKTTERQLKKQEQKLLELQSSLTHSQISRDSCKRQLTKAIEFGKELVNEQETLLKQLSTRNKESKAAIKYGNNIASKMDSLKTQLKSVQKDAFEELATVEKRINEQDWSIESMKRDHEKEIASLVQELKVKDMFIARLIDQNAPSQPYFLYRDRHVSFS